MSSTFVLFTLAAFGLVLLVVQCLALYRHLREPSPKATSSPGVSVLKPLCGVDDELAANLAVFAKLDYPCYEVLLGVKDAADPAYSVARAAASTWPHLMRVILQRGEPGLNPKVNQLVTLAAEARYSILVVSDSNVRVQRNYLTEVVAYLEDPQVGLVTHPLVGTGAKGAGAMMDNLHLTTSIGPGVIGAKRVLGKDFVVAKSMALRRSDLKALGGFEVLKDVLAEDYVAGRLVVDELHKKIALSVTPIENVCCSRSMGDFVRRFARWSVLQRKSVGPFIYWVIIILNPVFLCCVALALLRSGRAAMLCLACCSVKTLIDSFAARALLGRGLFFSSLLLTPLKDLLVAGSWIYGVFANRVNWRGNRLLVLKGTRLVPPMWTRGLVPHHEPEIPSL